MTTAEPHTLEEMISLCGEEFGRLLGTRQTWRASRRDSAFEATGATPNEAAARLYPEIVSRTHCKACGLGGAGP